MTSHRRPAVPAWDAVLFILNHSPPRQPVHGFALRVGLSWLLQPYLYKATYAEFL